MSSPAPNFSSSPADQWASLFGSPQGQQTRMGPNGLEYLDPRTLQWIPAGATTASPGFGPSPPRNLGTGDGVAYPPSVVTPGTVNPNPPSGLGVNDFYTPTGGGGSGVQTGLPTDINTGLIGDAGPPDPPWVGVLPKRHPLNPPSTRPPPVVASGPPAGLGWLYNDPNAPPPVVPPVVVPGVTPPVTPPVVTPPGVTPPVTPPVAAPTPAVGNFTNDWARTFAAQHPELQGTRVNLLDYFQPGADGSWGGPIPMGSNAGNAGGFTGFRGNDFYQGGVLTLNLDTMGQNRDQWLRSPAGRQFMESNGFGVSIPSLDPNAVNGQVRPPVPAGMVNPQWGVQNGQWGWMAGNTGLDPSRSTVPVPVPGPGTVAANGLTSGGAPWIDPRYSGPIGSNNFYRDAAGPHGIPVPHPATRAGSGVAPAVTTPISTSPDTYAGITRPAFDNGAKSGYRPAPFSSPTGSGGPMPITGPFMGGNPFGYADGGPIKGPGGPRQDNLLIRASNGEFVVPADVVRHKGTEFFGKLIDKTREDLGPNFAPRPARGYADGGFLDESAGLDMTPAGAGISLPASASPGLEALPAMGDSPAPGFSPPASAVNPTLISEPPGTPAAAPAPSAVSAFKAQRPDEDKEYLQNLPTMQKVGLMLQAFGAGVNGQPDPIQGLLKARSAQKAAASAEITTGLANIKSAYAILDAIPDGPQKAAQLEMLARQNPQLADILSAHGSEDEPAVRGAMANLTPSAQKYVAGICDSQPNKLARLKCVQTTMLDKEGSAKIEGLADMDNLPTLSAKLTAMVKSHRAANGDTATLTLADVSQLNAALAAGKNPQALNDSELMSAGRLIGSGMFDRMGIESAKSSQVRQEATIRKGEQGTESDPYPLNGALVQKNSVTGKVTTAVSRAPQTNISLANQGANAVIPSQHADLHGEDYIATLPPGVANVVKSIADGSASIKDLSSRMGNREAMLARVKQYEPTFDTKDYPTMLAVKKGFTSGAEAKNVTSLNTAIAHAGTLSELFDAMQNNDLPKVNKVVNYVKANLGKSDVTTPQAAIQALSTELMRAFRGAGAGSEREIQEWQSTLPLAGSPAQQKDSLGTVAKLLEGRITALDDQYKRGTKSDTGFPDLLSPKSKSTIAKIGGGSSGGDVATQAKAAWGSYDPNSYDYRVDPATGKLQRKPK